MIAKRVARRRDGKSSFGALIKYLQDDKGKTERVGDVTVTNCSSDDSKWAVFEIEATQDLNRRAKSDKTYHLVFSFREGEDVSPEVLRQIENELCKGLGFEEHQRISVVHRDTDNLHVHVAINKIHPATLNMIEPYYDHKRLGELCAQIEQQHGLLQDNHLAKKSRAESIVDDLAAKSGLETFGSWLREKTVPGIELARSWSELHEHFAQHGVEIKQKGAGLVLVGNEGVAVKASSVNRGLSIKALEARLGTFVPSKHAAATKKTPFKPRARAGVGSANLFAKHKSHQAQSLIVKKEALAQLQRDKEAAIALVLNAGKTKRAATKMLKGLGAGAISRKLLYSQIAKSQKAALAKVNEDFAERRKKIHTESPKKAFRDWLSDAAVKGDAEALAYLRSRAVQIKGNTLDGQNNSTAPQIPDRPIQSVTRRGTVVYSTPSGPIRDDGNRFQLDKDPADAAIAAALQMAIKRHGNKLTLTGDDAFKSKVEMVASHLKLDVSFVSSGVRKSVNFSNSGPFGRMEAANKYIAERNEKRSKTFDIMKHRNFEETDNGLYAFSGLRRIDDVSVALFKRDEEVLVLPVSPDIAGRLKRQKLGQMIQVKASGEIQVKGTTKGRT